LPDAAGEVLSLLLNAGMLAEVDAEGISSEDKSDALRCWEFHDLLFHARSRTGRHDAPVGGTFRLLGQVDPPPVLKPVIPANGLPLHRPDLDRLERDDPPFARVQEERCSIRDYGDTPLSDQQLGEFLYRVGRVADYWEMDVRTPSGPIRMAVAPRPYPAPGALYELELYIAVRSCVNLPAGLYHYDPERHQLNPVAEWTSDVEQLLADAGRAAGIPTERLQVLVVLAARFPRIAWKYASIAYSLTLKQVGVLYQTMYLAATAMGLAPCAIGCGNADLFARAAGADYYAETSVGEFLLGSRG
jgi:SagB-type dehydrogenase family enzyme